MTSPLLTMNDGRSIPQLGLGVYKVSNDDASKVVQMALSAGYRHIDTAAFYDNERGVGLGIAASEVRRDDVFVTTKVWNDCHGYDETQRACDESITALGIDYIDLYLIHWPAPAQNLYVETWRALERLKADGKVRSIGVSNFTPAHLTRLQASTEITPVLNQVELHPLLQQDEVREFDGAHGILTQAWSPLARGGVLGNERLQAIATKHDKTVAQVVIRWHLELGNVVIPKSVAPTRISENFDVFDFTLDTDDMNSIDALECDGRTGAHPDENG